jgi:bifunctional non-homologous end joining protein LigD
MRATPSATCSTTTGEIAPVILPYLKDRPQVLHRHVDGHEGKEFFQRISRGQPSWVQTAKMPNKQ